MIDDSDLCTAFSNLLDYPLSKQTIESNFDALYTWIDKQEIEYSFTEDWVRKLIHVIDDIWFNGIISNGIKYKYEGPLRLHFDIKNLQSSPSQPVIVGYVQESNRRKHINLHMNVDLLTGLFKESLPHKSGYLCGGLKCDSLIKCFIQALVHELVHVFLSILDKALLYDDSEENIHNDTFQKITKNLFGHTDIKHGFIPEIYQFQDLEQIKNSVKKGEEWFVAQIGNNPKPIKIHSFMGEDKVCSSDYCVNMALLRTKEENCKIREYRKQNKKY